MPEHHDHADDELLRRARELKDKTAQNQQKNSQGTNSRLGEFVSGNETLAGILSFGRALKRWTGPVGSTVAWLFVQLGAYIKFACFRRENGEYVQDEDGNLDFSLRRMIYVLLFTVFGLFALHVGFSAAYYYSTYFHEMVYVTGKQEIETGELYQFGGCTSLPCSTASDNGKFYLIETSLYFPVLLYPEEEVFANIPQQNGACDIEGYGIYFRSLRWLYKHAQLYQHVVRVSCRPYTEEEIKQAVTSGEIVPGPGN